VTKGPWALGCLRARSRDIPHHRCSTKQSSPSVCYRLMQIRLWNKSRALQIRATGVQIKAMKTHLCFSNLFNHSICKIRGLFSLQMIVIGITL